MVGLTRTLAIELAARLREHHKVSLFHLEDIYPGWNGLAACVERYVATVLTVVAVSVGLAILLSRLLQRWISRPLVELATTDPNADIALWIHSPGGSVPAMLAIRDGVVPLVA